MQLADFVNVTPDVMVLPSAIDAFAKVIESVVVVNPGGVSKKKTSGTFVEMVVGLREVEGEDSGRQNQSGEQSGESMEEAEVLRNDVWKRARVDVLRV